MHSFIRPNTFIALRLPSGALKTLEIVPNTSISIGKFGTFPANLLLGRPYNLTFEIDDNEKNAKGKVIPSLRVVPVAELNAEAVTSNASSSESREDDGATENADGGVEFDIVGENGQVIMKNNKLTVDDASRQTLTYDEIEELKNAGTASGKEIIAKIMASHMNIDEKTKFSLHKYTVRKSKKYLKRFTVLAVDVAVLVESLIDREASRIRELREETLGLISSWSNVHYSASNQIHSSADGKGFIGGGRWLVVDDTGGISVASLAERMGILYQDEDDEENDAPVTEQETADGADEEAMDVDSHVEELQTNGGAKSPNRLNKAQTSTPTKNQVQELNMSATTNTLTLIHDKAQPNTGLLKYFGYDTSSPDTSHPLYRHLKTISWAQLLYPERDAGYEEPEIATPETIATWKAAKRGTYYRKRRRWERIKRVVDETRAGGFDGLIVAAQMDPTDILKHAIPLLRGGAQIVVYSPTVEQLTELMDYCSKERKNAYLHAAFDGGQVDERDFPFNPTLILGSMLQTARARHWQVLPGRTHPLMTSRGLAEGYLFTATKVLPAEGNIQARGVFTRKKKGAVQSAAESPAKAMAQDLPKTGASVKNGNSLKRKPDGVVEVDVIEAKKQKSDEGTVDVQS